MTKTKAVAKQKTTLNVTDDNRLELLLAFENQIKLGTIQVAYALQLIRDYELYTARKAETMSEYLENYFPQSASQGRKLLAIADRFFDAKTPALLENFSVTNLLEISKDPSLVDRVVEAEVFQGEVTMADGEVIPLDEFIEDLNKQARVKFEAEERKMKTKLGTLKSSVIGKDEVINSYKAQMTEASEKITRLEEALTNLSRRKDIDPAQLTFISQKTEALELLDESTTQILKNVSKIEHIPAALIDAEVGAKISFAISAFEAAVLAMREKFDPHAWLPPARKAPAFDGDVVPE